MTDSSSSTSKPIVAMAADPEKHDILNVNVGVLGHVDSGKTSLVKALSTLLSTAALDKSVQSRQRGMTLDLGFSCFFTSMPEHLKRKGPSTPSIESADTSATPKNDSSDGAKPQMLQITLVDCPGHASLIRTIIGGAQIIDMVLLVVDAFKGWQAQTTECLVLAELTSPHLVVALNKADLLTNDQQLEKAKAQVQERLRQTRFANAPIVPVSACVGGEKIAATGGTPMSKEAASAAAEAEALKKNETLNIDLLVNTLKDSLPPPRRDYHTGNDKEGAPPFYFSIDHCFTLRGRGTILTGTVLSGATSTNDVLEFPTLALERKVKSIQMFKRQVSTIRQGDRAGICVSNLDAKLLERGIAATPGAVQLWKSAIAVVRKVKYYKGTLHCNSKFHISVGHSTVMATVTFWGARELYDSMKTKANQIEQDTKTAETQVTETTTSNKAGKKKKGQSSDKELQSSSLGGGADMAGLPSLAFDFDRAFLNQDQLAESIDEETTGSVEQPHKSTEPLLHWAFIDFQTPVRCPIQSLIIGSRLDTVDTNSTGASSTGSVSSCRLAFSGRLVQIVEPSDINRIRLYSPKERQGVISRLGDKHKRSDDGRIVRYEVFGSDLFKKETNMKLFIGMKVETEQGDVGEIKSSFGTSGKFRVFFPAGTEAREGSSLYLRFKRFAHDPDKIMHQDIVLPAARPGALLDVQSNKKKGKKEKLPEGIKRVGEVVTIKGDVLENGKHNTAIIAGFFAPEINIKERAGVMVRIPSTKEEGSIVGPFGKAGKCKVLFESGISAEIGAKAELQL